MQNPLENNHLIEIHKENLQINDLIENYKIIKYLDEGSYGKVYLVENINDGNQYALKLLNLAKSSKVHIQEFNNEIQIFNELAKPNNIIVDNNNRYVARLYSHGNIQFEFNKSEQKHVKTVASKYIVIDYYPKKELHLYFKFIQHVNGFTEDYAKVIFKKIAQGVKFCHDNNICHLDLKVENIILNNNYEPNIIDFGFSQKTIDQNGNNILVNIRKGTWKYLAPEVYNFNNDYNGKKADIFSLGAILFNLVSGTYGFNSARDKKYRKIRLNLIQQYWDNFIFYNFSDQFKNLYLRMVNPNPDLRPTIDDVLGDPWLQNINEEGFINKMQEIEQQINAEIRAKKLKKFARQGRNNTRSVGDNDKKYFNKDMQPDKLPFEKDDLQYYIIIKGDMKPFELMNDLTNLIQKNSKNKCFIEVSKTKLKLKIIFEKEGEDKDEKNENEENKDKENELEEDDCEMKLELYETEDNEYLLHFVKLEGDIEEFYEHFIEIRKIIEDY